MITITVPQVLMNLTKAELDYIAFKTYRAKVYQTVHVLTKRAGRYLTVSDGNSVHYVCVSKPENDARNARLMQFVTPTYTAWYEEKNKNKFLDIYLSKITEKDKNDYSKLFYRCFLTLGINILNINDLNLPELVPFNSYFDLKQYRERNARRNIHNRATYFSEDADRIELFAKTFGANQMESFIFALVLRKLFPNKKITLYPVVDNKAKVIAKAQKKILVAKGVKFGETISYINNANIKLSTIVPGRDTPKYHYNLFEKYGRKKCLLCGCDMDHLIIGSHIERVADIKKSKIYSDEEKIRRIVDGENGFWLCANHDKMFEFGIIYFKNKKLCYRSGLRENDTGFINRSIMPDNKNNKEEIPFEIPQQYVSDQMEEYLSQHRKRVGVDD